MGYLSSGNEIDKSLEHVVHLDREKVLIYLNPQLIEL